MGPYHICTAAVVSSATLAQTKGFPGQKLTSQAIAVRPCVCFRSDPVPEKASASWHHLPRQCAADWHFPTEQVGIALRHSIVLNNAVFHAGVRRARCSPVAPLCALETPTLHRTRTELARGGQHGYLGDGNGQPRTMCWREAVRMRTSADVASFGEAVAILHELIFNYSEYSRTFCNSRLCN